MDSTPLFLITLTVVLAIWALVLTILFFRLKRRNDRFFDAGDENILELLKSVVTDNDKVKKRSEKVEMGLDEAVKIMKRSFQKQAIIRYNPFKETGGNQSFSMAVLDYEKNGFVLTSIHGREADRVYAKPIVNGKSEHNLSAEEVEAIKKAIE
jgi:hypothetical protein